MIILFLYKQCSKFVQGRNVHIQNIHHQNSLIAEYGHVMQFRLVECKHKFILRFEDYSQEACAF